MIMNLIAWDPIDKKMGVVDTYHPKTGKVMFENDSWDWYKRDRIVRRPTGLKDKNGKDIYESDIVKQTYHAETGHVYDGTDMSFDGHHIGAVVITASQGVCMKKPLCWSMETDDTTLTNQYKRVAGYRCEVIGNIYENPDLLEDKHE